MKKLIVLLGILLSIDSYANSPEPETRPNILFILADDVRYGDLNFSGKIKFHTPNIDQLAKDGMFFTHIIRVQP